MQANSSNLRGNGSNFWKVNNKIEPSGFFSILKKV